MKFIKNIFLLSLVFSVFVVTRGYAEPAAGGQNCERWDNGNKRECTGYGPGGELTKTYYREDGTLQQAEKYDPDGDKIEESYYGSDGKLAKNPVAEWAAMKWEYKNGNLIEESYYGASGHLTQRNLYDPYGNLAERQFVGDGRLDEAEEFEPAVSGEETDQFYSRAGRMKYETSAIVE